MLPAPLKATACPAGQMCLMHLYYTFTIHNAYLLIYVTYVPKPMWPSSEQNTAHMGLLQRDFIWIRMVDIFPSSQSRGGQAECGHAGLGRRGGL